MPQGTYKVDEAIEVTYQAAGATTGLVDVTMEIYDETGAKDISGFPDIVMTEIGATGRYKGSFTPDVEGKWRVMIDSVTKPGKMVKDFDVVAANINSIGDAIASVDTKLDSTELSIRGGNSDTLETLSDQIDGIPGAADSAPSIG